MKKILLLLSLCLVVWLAYTSGYRRSAVVEGRKAYDAGRAVGFSQYQNHLAMVNERYDSLALSYTHLAQEARQRWLDMPMTTAKSIDRTLKTHGLVVTASDGDRPVTLPKTGWIKPGDG